MKGLLSIVVPVYNEEKVVGDVLTELVAYCTPRQWQIIVVDDGSSDGSGVLLDQFAERYDNVLALHHKMNVGYGGALKTGILHADTSYVLTFDADGQHCVDDIERVMAFALEEDADLVVGRRHEEAQRNLYRTVGKWLIRTIAGFLLPMQIKDLNSGFKFYDTALVKRYLRFCPDSMAFSDIITMVFISQHHLVLECPINTRSRNGGKSTINILTAFDTMFEILNVIVLFNPMRIFFPAAFLCVLAGLVWGTPIVLMGRGISVGSMLAIVTGIILFFLGLVTAQFSMLRKEMSFLVENSEKDDLVS